MEEILDTAQQKMEALEQRIADYKEYQSKIQELEAYYTSQQRKDDKDQDAIHVFCWNDSGRVAGCLRVFWKNRDEAAGVAQIGRVVTLEHGKGLGGKMLHEGVRIAREILKAKKIYLEAQEYAIGYYAKEGFEVVSDPFMEDGIPHVKMERKLD